MPTEKGNRSTRPGEHTKSNGKMAIEIVDFPIKNGYFPLLWDSSPEGTGFFLNRNEGKDLQWIMGGKKKIHPACHHIFIRD